MSLKNLVPMGVRNILRPTYQRACHGMRRARQSFVDAGFGMKPDAWKHLLTEIESIDDPKELYCVAEREFGILQIENEIVPFLKYVATIQPKVVGEIGVKFGGNTFLFERALPSVQRLIGVDLVLQNVGKARFLARSKQRLRFIEGSSYSPAVIERVRRWLGRDRFDFLFIDGDHSYSGVVQDFLAYYPMVRPGGLIAVHDIAPDELGRFGTRSPESMNYGGEVFLLWRRLREQFPHEMFVQSWDQFGYGIGVITKPDDSPLPQDWVTSLQNSDVARSMTIQ